MSQPPASDPARAPRDAPAASAVGASAAGAGPTVRTVHRICPLCEACCGLELQVQGEHVLSVRGHDADVFSRGYLCPKGVALKDLHEDPDRLRTPLVRRGGELVPASWDDAFAEIEARLLPLRERHGKDAVAIALGNPGAHKMGLALYFPRLFRALGTKNFFSASTLDQMPKQLANGLMYGEWLSVALPDIERCELLLMLGANPMASNGSLWTVPDFRGKARALRERGGALIVVDPRRTETAAVADEHLAIRPGGDVFFLLGLVHTLFDEGLVRLGRLAPHVVGVEALQQAVRPFAPERMADGCGIEASTMRALARRLATTERAAVYGRLGTCAQVHGSLNSWLIDVLNVLTGHLDEPGGAMFPKAPAFAANTMGAPGRGRGIAYGRHRSRVSGAPEVFGELPMGCLAEEIETPGDGQVRALITIASNPALSAPNGPRLARAMAGLDFMLSLDIYVNETTRHADVILPALSPLEEPHYDVAFSQLSFRNQARYSPASMPAQGRPAEWQTMLRLIALLDGRGLAADLGQLDDELLARDLKRLGAGDASAWASCLEGLEGPDRLLALGLHTGPYGAPRRMSASASQSSDGKAGTRAPSALAEARAVDRELADDGQPADDAPLSLGRLQATPEGIDLGALRPRVPELLRTPSGLVELAPARFVEALGALTLPGAPPELVVIGRRQVRSNNSWMHNLPTLAKGPFRCTALVNPVDAQRLGLPDGAMASMRRADTAADGTSGEGAAGTPAADASPVITVQVQLSDEVGPGVVSLPHGWGHDAPGARLRVAAERPGANLNALLDEAARDPLSGNAVLGGVAITLRPLTGVSA